VIIDGKELHKEIESPGNIGIVVENAGLYLTLPAFTILNILQVSWVKYPMMK